MADEGIEKGKELADLVSNVAAKNEKADISTLTKAKAVTDSAIEIVRQGGDPEQVVQAAAQKLKDLKVKGGTGQLSGPKPAPKTSQG